MKTGILFTILILLFCNAFSQSKEFFSKAINSTILICKENQGVFIPHGTAFSFYNYNSKPEESILITCEHLTHHDTLVALIPALDSIKKQLKLFNKNKFEYYSEEALKEIPFDGNNFVYKFSLKLNVNFFKHPFLDLAVIYCDLPNTFGDEKGEIVITNIKRIPKSFIASKSQIYPGQEITFIGFPSAIGTPFGFNLQGPKIFGDLKSNPLLRKGVISWTSENSNLLLIDGFSYSGNSGSPIFSTPNLDLEGKFIGMVIGHLTDDFEFDNMKIDTTNKVLFSNKTYIPMNNGLAQCIPAYIISDFVDETLIKRKLIISK
jgi:hypothetical protein